jgi:hypothetical protein
VRAVLGAAPDLRDGAEGAQLPVGDEERGRERHAPQHTRHLDKHPRPTRSPMDWHGLGYRGHTKDVLVINVAKHDGLGLGEA